MTNTEKETTYILRKNAMRDMITNCNMLDNQINYLYDTDWFRERLSSTNPLCRILSHTRWSL